MEEYKDRHFIIPLVFIISMIVLTFIVISESKTDNSYSYQDSSDVLEDQMHWAEVGR